MLQRKGGAGSFARVWAGLVIAPHTTATRVITYRISPYTVNYGTFKVVSKDRDFLPVFSPSTSARGGVFSERFGEKTTEMVSVFSKHDIVASQPNTT